MLLKIFQLLHANFLFTSRFLKKAASEISGAQFGDVGCEIRKVHITVLWIEGP